MIAATWPVFILRTGGSPLLFDPFKVNPKFTLYLSAAYFTYGSVTTPFLLTLALALAPIFDKVLSTLRERLGCPQWLAMAALCALYAGGFVVFLVVAVLAACAICRTPVWVA
eukprot:CAMPEP_0171110852 /NCGR_PEP_ID=MMETSP0766_2-20121228/72806_1 /TAXON_ID=439317 /ORGANISM="Gambierdiscus australes, Strain CAWD 149" /LENGTH=111 /DNA_ID=CAMNT_0011572775 /DNA_START=87 /DNA_END=422 /DNA_ORIENTATION=-